MDTNKEIRTVYQHFLCMLLFFNAIVVEARPISYPGGWTVMQKNEMDIHSLHLHYSPSSQYSVGYRLEYWENKDWSFHGLQVNYLIKRWNNMNSQANFYFKNAVGLAINDGSVFKGHTQAGVFSGIACDWENRRFFISYENRGYYLGDIETLFMQKSRIGVTPYIGNYGDLHTWLMLQADHNPEVANHVIITPLVRLFKGEYLAEIGVSDNGDLLLNWIIRF
jgi:hypothetical protein